MIVAVDGTPVKDTRTLIDRVSALPPGQKVELEVIREGKRPTVTVTLGERPSNGDEQETSTATEDTPASKLGIQVDDLTQRTRRQFEIPREIEGVVVTDVTDLSPADDADLRPGDVVMRVNEVDVTSEREFKDAVSRVRSGSMVRFYVYRSQGDVEDVRVPPHAVGAASAVHGPPSRAALLRPAIDPGQTRISSVALGCAACRGVRFVYNY